jgi:hypothetical protein
MRQGSASRGGVGVLCLAMVVLGAACAHRPPAPTPATVRYAVQAPCFVCDIESVARQLAGERALDCGSARDPRDEAALNRVAACARKAEAEGVPFLALMHWPGIDSEVIEGFVRAPDGSLSDLWYDSDVSGGGRNCSAVVTRGPCGRLVPHPEWPGFLRCEPKERRDTVCQEQGYTAGPRVDASDLMCHWSESGQHPYDVCRRVEPGKGNVPPGADLVCRQRSAERPDVFDCSRSAEADAALGIRWTREALPEVGGTPRY